MSSEFYFIGQPTWCRIAYVVCRISYVGKVKNLKSKVQNHSVKFKIVEGLGAKFRLWFFIGQPTGFQLIPPNGAGSSILTWSGRAKLTLQLFFFLASLCISVV